jgi:hypothetical protein
MIAFLFPLVIVGVLAYILEHYVPMDPVFRLLVRLVIVLIVLGYLVRLLGVPWGPPALRVP